MRLPGMRFFFALLLFAISDPLVAEKDFSGLSNELGVAKAQFQQGKFDAALAVLDRLEKSSRPSMESLDLRGCVYLEQGKFEEAAKAFDGSHAFKFDAFAPRIHHADALLAQKKFTEAGNEYERLIQVKSPMWPDYARFGLLLAYLGGHEEALAKRVYAEILFPTETPAYYYAQAAWAFGHGKKSDAQKWIGSAKKIFDSGKTAWFDRALYQLGWIKKKPPPSVDPFF